MLFDVRSAIPLMPYLVFSQVALLNSSLYGGLCRVREQLLNLGIRTEEGEKNNG